MKRYKTISLFCLIYLLSYSLLFAQAVNNDVGDVVMPPPESASLGKYNDIPVGHYTGVPNISVPIHAVQDGPLSLPISISYHASGVRIGEPASWVGTSWSLMAGGMISRTVQGLADEGASGYLMTSPSDTLDVPLGGTYPDCNCSSGNETEPDELIYCNNCGPESLPAGSGDYTSIADGALDGEPDIFSYNVGGYTGKFYFRPSGEIVQIPLQNVKIESGWSPPTHGINWFRVTTPDGVKYTFGDASGNSNGVERLATGNTAPYVSGWKLTKIQDPNDLYAIDLQYTLEQYSYRSKASWTDPGGSPSNFTHFNIDGQRLSSITTSEGKESITFVASASVREDIDFAPPYYSGVGGSYALERIEVTSGVFCKAFVFQYDYFVDNSAFKGNDRFDKRLRLESLTEQSCDGSVTKPPYQFKYYSQPGNPDFLPNRLSPAIDHWGYYNGQDAAYTERVPIPYRASIISNGTNQLEYEVNPTGVDRETHEEFMLLGNLKRIIYPTGGSHQFEYEANIADNYEGEVRDSNLLDDASLCPGCSVPASASTSITFTYNSQYEYAYSIDLGTPCNLGGGAEYVKACIGTDCVPQLSEGSGDLLDLFDATNFVDGQSYTINIEGYRYCLNSFKLYEIDVWTTNKVGGLRVKKITSDDAMGQRIMKTYEYSASNIPGQSSGYLFNAPKYWGIFAVPNPTKACYDPIQGRVRCHSSAYKLQHYSYSLTPLSGFDGNHVVYNRVLEHHYGEDTNAYNGSRVFNYFTDDEVVPPPYSMIDPNIIESFPFAPSQANIKAGNLSESRTVDVSSNPVAYEINTPKYENYTYSTDKIVKAARIQVTQLNSAIYFIHYKIRTRPLYRLQSVESFIDGVRVVRNIDYNSPHHYFPTAEYFTNSDGKEQRTETIYAEDAGETEMINRYMIGIPIEVEKKVNGAITGGSKTEYQLFGNHLLPKFYYQILEGGTPLLRTTVDYFTTDGKIQSITRRGFAPEVYTWVDDLPKTKSFLNFNWSYEYYPGTRMLKSITDIKDVVSHFKYDKLMRLKRSESRNGGLFARYKYYYTLAGGGDPNYVEVYTNEDDVTRYNYIDGLGRELQTLSLGYGPDMGDVVHGAVEYDEFGRVARQFQPHPGNGTYNPPGGPHDRFDYETSPLSRELKRTFADGANMQTTYSSNTAGDAVTNYQTGGTYPSGELYKVTVLDEKGHPTITFKDKIDRVVLIRKKWDGNNVDTYYQYDDRDNLIAVMPPGCSSPTDIHVGYQYSYDDRNRMETKKLPGAGTQTFSYNDRDEVTSSIDGNGNVVGYEYDGHGRDTLTLLQKPSSQQAVPIIYKQYDGNGGGSMGELVSENKSVLNGSSSTAIQTSYSYDEYGRVRRMQDGAYRGGSDNFEYTYDAATDRVRQIIRNYGQFGWQEHYLYDHVGREKVQLHKMTRGSLYDSRTTTTRASEYDIKDQLISKSLDYLQNIGYGYDLRGRLTQINKLPLPYDDSYAPIECGGSGGGGGAPNDSTACGGQTINMEDLLDLMASDEELDIDCYGDGCDEEAPLEICDFNLTTSAVESVCAIYNAAGVNVHFFSAPISSSDPNMATLLQAELVGFLDTYGHDYENVSVSYTSGELSISITGTTFQFGGLDACGENGFPFIGDCQEITSFPTGTPGQVAQQQASMQTLSTSMASLTTGNVQYPTTLYKLNLYQGEVAFVLEQEIGVIDGEYGYDDCVEIQNENTNIVFREDENTYQKTFAQVLQLRQTEVLDGAIFDGDTGNCETEVPKCYLTETYPAKAVVATSVIFDSIGTPTIPSYINLSTQNFNKRDFSLEEDNLYWEVGDNYVSRGEVGWDIGYNTGGSNLIVSSFQVKIKGVTEIEASLPPGYFLIGLHDGQHFVKIDEGDGYFRNFVTNGLLTEITLTVADPELISPYRLDNLQLALYMSSASFSIDAVEVEIEYESSCELCNGEAIPCGRSEREQQQNDLANLQNTIQNTSASQLSYPLMLHQVQLCDGTVVYLLDSELAQLSGSYGILQDLEITSSSQIFKVYTPDGQASDLSFSDLIELRKTDPNLLIQGPGCPVNIDYEQGVACFYKLYQDQWTYTNIPNSNLVKVDYEEIVEKQCGNGPIEEVSRTPASIEVEVVKTYDLGAEFLQAGEAYLDSLQLRTKNPAGTLSIDLNPTTVLTTYPGLAGTLTTSHLYYDGDANRLQSAVETVINYAIGEWAQQRGTNPPLYRLSLSSGSGGGLGYLNIGFSIYHQPTEAYIAIDPNSSSLVYRRSNSTPPILELPGLVPGSESIETFNNSVPCGLISANYSDAIVDVSNLGFDQLPLNTPSPTRLGGDDCEYNTIATPVSSCDRPQRIWNGTVFEECDYCTPPPPTCSEAELLAQQAYVDSIKNLYTAIDTSDLVLPDSLHQVMLCDGSLIYIFGQHLEDIPGGTTTVQSIPVGGTSQTFEVDLRDTTDLFAMRLYYEPNGNVEKVRWQVKFQPEQQYIFKYDDLDRMEESTYSGQGWLSNASYSENVTYKDGRGNIATLTRGGYNGSCNYALIDDLVYTYDQGNKVIRIEDKTGNDRGFKYRPGSPGDEYRYDANGNMVYDWHKGIDTIGYNYLNLPGSIILGGVPLDYIYDAAGKKHRSPGPYDFVNNVHYSPDGFEAVYTDEGRVVPIFNDSLGIIDSFQYEWVMRDHLGNGRVYFSDLDKNLGVSSQTPQEVLQERHYYPFGLMFEGAFYPQVGPVNEYTYNTKRFHREGDLNWYDYGKRWYDAAIGRFPSLDPIADEFHHFTPYNYAENNPSSAIDWWGLQAEYVDGRLVGYIVQAGQGPSQIAKDLNDNHSDKIKGKIEWQNIVYGNLNKFKNVVEGDGKIFDAHNEDYKSGNIQEGYYLEISDGFQGDKEKLKEEIDVAELKLDTTNELIRANAEQRDAIKEMKADPDERAMGVTHGHEGGKLGPLNALNKTKRDLNDKQFSQQRAVDSLKNELENTGNND